MLTEKSGVTPINRTPVNETKFWKVLYNQGDNFTPESIEDRLFDFCRWNSSDRVQSLLSSSSNIDIFYDNGKFFDLAISNNSPVILKALLNYFEQKKLIYQGDERLKFEYKLKNILYEYSSQYNLPEEISELISPYLEGFDNDSDEEELDHELDVYSDLSGDNQDYYGQEDFK